MCLDVCGGMLCKRIFERKVAPMAPSRICNANCPPLQCYTFPETRFLPLAQVDLAQVQVLTLTGPTNLLAAKGMEHFDPRTKNVYVTYVLDGFKQTRGSR